MRQQAFKKSGRFYKGNLHAHTTISDGTRPVSEVIGIYKGKGYDFLAITDHNTVFKSDEFNDEIYIVPALEIHSGKPGTDKTHHMVGLTTYDNPMVSHGQRIENVEWTDARGACDELCNKMKPMGFELIYCHSLWSRIEPAEFMNSGLMAMEIYNGVCEWACDQGLQTTHWDILLRNGLSLWGVASDDSHNVDTHYGRGYVMIKADELSDHSIIEAIKEGEFYSSQGPEIYDFFVEDGTAHVKCSPAEKITFIAYESRGRSFSYDEPQTEDSLEIRDGFDYIRAEITDVNGKRAWTNPIFL